MIEVAGRDREAVGQRWHVAAIQLLIVELRRKMAVVLDEPLRKIAPPQAVVDHVPADVQAAGGRTAQRREHAAPAVPVQLPAGRFVAVETAEFARGHTDAVVGAGILAERTGSNCFGIPLAVVADTGSDQGFTPVAGGLGDEVDRAAKTVAPIQRILRSFRHFDARDVVGQEKIQCVALWHVDAIDEEADVRLADGLGQTADDDAGSGRAGDRHHGQARHQHLQVGRRGQSGRLDVARRHHVDGNWHILHQLGTLGRGDRDRRERVGLLVFGLTGCRLVARVFAARRLRAGARGVGDRVVGGRLSVDGRHGECRDQGNCQRRAIDVHHVPHAVSAPILTTRKRRCNCQK